MRRTITQIFVSPSEPNVVCIPNSSYARILIPTSTFFFSFFFFSFLTRSDVGLRGLGKFATLFYLSFGCDTFLFNGITAYRSLIIRAKILHPRVVIEKKIPSLFTDKKLINNLITQLKQKTKFQMQWLFKTFSVLLKMKIC